MTFVFNKMNVQTEAISAVNVNYSTLCKTIDEISSSGRDEYAIKANGYLQQM